MIDNSYQIPLLPNRSFNIKNNSSGDQVRTDCFETTARICSSSDEESDSNEFNETRSSYRLIHGHDSDPDEISSRDHSLRGYSGEIDGRRMKEWRKESE